MQRDKLAFRLNTEGYFFDTSQNILAKIDGERIIFPGGGLELHETAEQAIIRETQEETGAIVCNVKLIDIYTFIYPNNWATTDKQRKRFATFQGEKMHFFVGKIEKMCKRELSESAEDSWAESKLYPLNQIIELVRKRYVLEKNNEYVKKQLELLSALKPF